jgi:hypothetical protein
VDLKARFLGAVAVLGYPLVFAVGFCIFGMATTGQSRFVSSLLAEGAALVVVSCLLLACLKTLSTLRYAGREPNVGLLVGVVASMFVVLSAVTLANAATSGAFAEGGSRLEFYFANDWFRRLVTFSYVPMAVATYYSVYAILTPLYRRRRAAFVFYLLTLFLWSLVAGSKGAAILMIAGVAPFVFSTKKLPLFKLGIAFLIVTVLYLAIFLALIADGSVSLFQIAMRFFLSIDMSLLLQDQGTSEFLAGRMGDVWLEVFRSVRSLGVRISDEPIGSVIYQYVLGSVPTVGANCRFGSLLLLYPDRVDFLLLFPVVVIFVATLLGDILRSFGLVRGAAVAMPIFSFNAFQDVYWFASHVLPIALLFGVVQLARIVSRGPVHHSSNAA